MVKCSNEISALLTTPPRGPSHAIKLVMGQKNDHVISAGLKFTGCFLGPDIKRFCLIFTLGPDRIWYCLILVSDFFLQLFLEFGQ